ncbi:MAG: hypothetical protein RBU21_11030 [FCB group bacterium]|nr:hypothetical protein [FCB group bacterium]
MPCSDITEVIEVVIDNEDRLKRYAFSKRTCGQGVGVAALLLDCLQGRSVDDILAWESADFVAEHPVEDELEEFLGLKHFFAVQSALEVLTGREPGGPGDPCAAAEISIEDGEVVINAQIRVDIVTEKIKSCGNCKGCGNKKSKVRSE